ncbi:MAG: hypothetical protein AAGB10_20210, partial [Pseudomonadota bacterium]
MQTASPVLGHGPALPPVSGLLAVAFPFDAPLPPVFDPPPPVFDPLSEAPFEDPKNSERKSLSSSEPVLDPEFDPLFDPLPEDPFEGDWNRSNMLPPSSSSLEVLRDPPEDPPDEPPEDPPEAPFEEDPKNSERISSSSEPVFDPEFDPLFDPVPEDPFEGDWNRSNMLPPSSSSLAVLRDPPEEPPDEPPEDPPEAPFEEDPKNSERISSS